MQPTNPLYVKLKQEFNRKKQINYQERRDKWALFNDKSCPNINNLNKIQPFVEYNNIFNREKQSYNERENYRNNYVENDNIAFKPHNKVSHREAMNVFKIKSLFGSHHETSKDSWVDKSSYTINNRSSVDYNILQPDEIKDNFWSQKIEKKLLSKNINNRQKSISEFSDLTATNSLRFNKELEQQYQKNPNIFKSYMGVFSNMYEMSARNGKISVPFKKSSAYENSSGGVINTGNAVNVGASFCNSNNNNTSKRHIGRYNSRYNSVDINNKLYSKRET